MSILELTKTVMFEVWYDYVKPKYGVKAKLCYIDTDNFIVYITTDYIYKDITENVETRFDTSSYKLNRPLPKGKKKKFTGVMKNHEIICRIKSKTL